MRKIVIAGEIFSANLGDGAIYYSLRHLFAEIGLEVVPLDISGKKSWSVVDSELARSSRFSLKKGFQKLIRRWGLVRKLYIGTSWYMVKRNQQRKEWAPIIESVDYVLIGGGQLITGTDFGFPPKLMEIASIARKKGKPLAIFGCGASEETGIVSRYIFRRIMRQAKYVSARDSYSAEVLKSYMRASGEVEVHPDPGFALGIFLEKRIIPDEDKKIGFSFQVASHFRKFVSDLNNLTDTEYESFWVNLINAFYEAGEKVVLLSNGDPADHSVICNVSELLRQKGHDVYVKPRPTTPEDLMSQFDDVKCLIATRMHAGIVAASFGAAVLPIFWDRKVVDVWSTLGFETQIAPPAVIRSEEPWVEIREMMPRTSLSFNELSCIRERLLLAAEKCILALEH